MIEILFAVVIVLVLYLCWSLTRDEKLTGPHPLTHINRSFVGINRLFPDCRDKDKRCPQWAAGYECRRNPAWMFKNCPRSCGVCHLSSAGKANEAARSLAYDREYKLIPCANKDPAERCATGAQARTWCRKHPWYMSNNCARTCGFCWNPWTVNLTFPWR